MPEMVERCPLCGGQEQVLLDERTFHGREVRNQLCRTCGLVFQSPRMDTAELAAFYETEYRQLYQGEAGPTRRDRIIQQGRAAALWSFARKHIPPPRRHLDIGCSSGALLERFSSHASQAVGVEPGDAYRAFARSRGLAVYPDLDDLRAEEHDPFDLISLAHVLEHFPDPVDRLVELRETVLAPGGWLLLEVPNLYAHTCFEVAHLISFSAHTLQETLRKAGFETRALRAHGQPRSVILPLYLTALARPISQAGPIPAVRRERAVTLKRRAGMLRRRMLQRAFPELAWLPIAHDGTDDLHSP